MSDALKGYLKAMRDMRGAAPTGYAFNSVEDYVLTRGHAYESQPLTPCEAEYVRLVRARGRFPVKQCFANSQRVVLDAEFLLREKECISVKYVEGYVLKHDLPIPIHHAWIDLNGKVIDLTLRKRLGSPTLVALGKIVGADYIGAPFTAAEVREFVLATKHWGSLLDDWHRGWPFLKG